MGWEVEERERGAVSLIFLERVHWCGPGNNVAEGLRPGSSTIRDPLRSIKPQVLSPLLRPCAEECTHYYLATTFGDVRFGGTRSLQGHVRQLTAPRPVQASLYTLA